MSASRVTAEITIPGCARRRLAYAIVLIASVAVISTSCDLLAGPSDVASVQVIPATWVFTSMYDTVRFRAQAKDASGKTIPGHSFTWRADPSGVVLIRPDGLATAIGPGFADVTATTDTVAGRGRVGVVQAITSVFIISAPSRLTALGDSQRLYVQAHDARGSLVAGVTFSFQSLNDNVVGVDTAGYVKAVTPGVASVVATASGSADTVSIEVRQDVATIELTPDSAIIEDGATRQFTRATKLGPAAVVATSDTTIGQAPVYVFTPFQAVSAGGGHTCALSTRGRPYCWGWSITTGQFNALPLAVPDAPELYSISVGTRLKCGLTYDGVSFCWGDPPFGPSATPVAGQLGFTALSAGFDEVYGLKPGGAFFWTPGAPLPSAVSGGLSFVTISAGDAHACGTVGSGAAYCWGNNGVGALGDSTYQNRSAPIAVHGGLALNLVAAGGNHTCGITTGGATYCWGSNSYGAFGDGTTTSSTIPAPAAVGLSLTSVTLANAHSCGLDGSGAAFCWGWGERGSLGDGTFDPMRLTPAPVSGGLTFQSIDAGAQHTCGLTATGALYCWGGNQSLELGDGTNVNRAVPTRVVGSRP